MDGKSRDGQLIGRTAWPLLVPCVSRVGASEEVCTRTEWMASTLNYCRAYNAKGGKGSRGGRAVRQAGEVWGGVRGDADSEGSERTKEVALAALGPRTLLEGEAVVHPIKGTAHRGDDGLGVEAEVWYGNGVSNVTRGGRKNRNGNSDNRQY